MYIKLTRGQDAFYRVVHNPLVLYEQSEGEIGFTEGVLSMPLYQVCKAKSL